ncbi:Protein of unknown function [Bacillus cereus]|nr:Protein of unknown function [Bacillus cereus]SCN42190.1 Protein of unknown function [Bacillus wiedmannii]
MKKNWRKRLSVALPVFSNEKW